jgi:serine/threonine protein kinase HipA of HipAB toxin-antitoxin module
MALLEISDLTPFATIDEPKATAMVEDAIAMAVMAAPCLAIPDELSPQQRSAAKALIRGAVLRWNDIGSGAVSAQTAGPFSQSVDTRQVRRSMYWPSEITDLQNICKGVTEKTGAFSVDTAAEPLLFHSTLCGWAGGGCTCSFDTIS